MAAQVIVITSGKGGVGKTTTSASISAGLALQGLKTVVIDFDVGLRNLDLVMGCERRVVYDLANVINNEVTLNQALIKDKRIPNLYILAASQTRDKDVLTKEGVGAIVEELKLRFDYIVCDSPAGIERGALMAMYYADHAFIVTNPEVSSVRDSDRILGILQSKTKRAEEGLEQVKENLIITRFDSKRADAGNMLSIESVVELLGVPLLGVVPESHSVLNASNAGQPVILNNKSDAGQEYERIIQRFLGRAPAYGAEEKESLFKRIFGRKKEVAA
jgi:septum site-determining protein MinD